MRPRYWQIVGITFLFCVSSGAEDRPEPAATTYRSFNKNSICLAFLAAWSDLKLNHARTGFGSFLEFRKMAQLEGRPRRASFSPIYASSRTATKKQRLQIARRIRTIEWQLWHPEETEVASISSVDLSYDGGQASLLLDLWKSTLEYNVENHIPLKVIGSCSTFNLFPIAIGFALDIFAQWHLQGHPKVIQLNVSDLLILIPIAHLFIEGFRKATTIFARNFSSEVSELENFSERANEGDWQYLTWDSRILGVNLKRVEDCSQRWNGIHDQLGFDACPYWSQKLLKWVAPWIEGAEPTLEENIYIDLLAFKKDGKSRLAITVRRAPTPLADFTLEPSQGWLSSLSSIWQRPVPAPVPRRK